jgi:O-antigen ligase
MLGMPSLLVALLAMISINSIPFLLLTLFVVLRADAHVRGNIRAALPKLDIVTVSIGAFILYAAASALWAAEPIHTLDRVGLAAIMALGTFAAIPLVRSAPRASLVPMAAGLKAGFLIGLVYLLVEVETDQAIKIWVYNALNLGPDILSSARLTWQNGKLAAIQNIVLNRNMTSVLLLLWPVLMLVHGTVARPWRRPLAILLVLLAVAVVFLAPHTTSKVAIVLGLVTFAIACKAWRFTYYVFAVAWVLSCLAVLPAAHLAYRLDFQDFLWLKPSGQHRVVIWNQTAEQALKAPILGRGADQTLVVGPIIEKTLPPEKFEKSLSVHAHNMFLQTWFELGLIGVLLLMAGGLAILWRIRCLTLHVQPFAYAMLGSCAAYFTAGYGMWQTWYVPLFGLAAVLFVLGQRMLEEAKAGHPVAFDAGMVLSPAQPD